MPPPPPKPEYDKNYESLGGGPAQPPPSGQTEGEMGASALDSTGCTIAQVVVPEGCAVGEIFTVDKSARLQ